MNAEAIRVRNVRQARVAIFGPGIVGFAGLVFVVVGAIGFAVNHSTTTVRTDAPSGVTGNSAPAVGGGAALTTTHGRFMLVDASGRAYPFGDFSNPIDAGAPLSAHPKPIVAAASAGAGGLWLATADGQVFASNAPLLGRATLAKHAARIVGIAGSIDGHGYRLVSSDGHVYPFGAPNRGDYSLSSRAARVIGIATSAADGYWIALSDGTVSPFGAPSLGRLTLGKHASPVVGIASALDGSGYWLATADGHVHAYGVPFRGDLSNRKIKARVVAIATSAQGGYWLTTADGKVFPFAAPMFGGLPSASPRAPIVAIVPY
jgi:hypothetical protein